MSPAFWQDDVIYIVSLSKQRSDFIICEASDSATDTGYKECEFRMFLCKQDKFINVWADGVYTALHGRDGITLSL